MTGRTTLTSAARVVVLLLVVAAGLASIVASGPISNTGLDQIVFQSNRNTNWQIYKVTSDGTGETRLTANSANDQLPQWSPDRKQILFVSNRDGNGEIYVMTADGQNQRNLTQNAAQDSGPVWSPDGRRIAFVRGLGNNAEVFVMNADGSGQTNISNHSAFDDQPAWSPDSKQVAFRSARDGNTYTIWIYQLEAQQLRQLTRSPDSTVSPAWSPDGAQIAYVRAFVGREDAELWVVNADGTSGGAVMITERTRALARPAWGGLVDVSIPKRIVYEDYGTGTAQLYVRIFESPPRTVRLTNDGFANTNPSWAPFDTFVLFESARDGSNVDLYRVNAAEGGNLLRVTTSPGIDANADW